MRYLMIAMLAACLTAPFLVGCDSHSKTTEKTNPFTGTHTVEKSSDTDTH